MGFCSILSHLEILCLFSCMHIYTFLPSDEMIEGIFFCPVRLAVYVYVSLLSTL